MDAGDRTMNGPPREEARVPFFGSFPRRGIWSAVGLGRGQFFGILLAAVAVYAFFGGPIWRRLGEDDFLRIAVSYAFIPVAVGLAQWARGTLRASLFLGGSAVIAALKLVITAGLALVIDLSTR